MKKYFLIYIVRDEILNIKIEDILIGDLLYDTYLKSKIKPTIDIKSKDFERFTLDFLNFFFWYNYFKNNDVNGVVASHGVYSYALILRIAETKKIPCYVISANYLSKFRSADFGGSIFGDYKNYKKNFSKVDLDIKKGIKKLKKS